MSNQTHILYEHTNGRIFVLDIPRSIVEAQFASATLDAGFYDLISCPPLLEPFSSTEPKTAKALQNVEKQTTTDPWHDSIVIEAAKVFQTLREDRVESFHLPRTVADTEQRPKRKRKRDGEHCTPESQQIEENNIDNLLTRLQAPTSTSRETDRITATLVTDVPWLSTTPLTSDNQSSETFPWDGSLLAPSTPSTCTIPSLSTAFLIPPHSAALLASCNNHTLIFRTLARQYAPATPHRPSARFDAIILDPPWPNRSARRANPYAQHTLSGISDLLHGLDLDTALAPCAHICIWVTNRAAVRDLVLAPGGLFDSWNVALVEEWVWVKIAADGQPVTPLAGVWRRPYEVCLVGRAPRDRLAVARDTPVGDVVRRWVVGVPDVHSRKPCLRALVERVLLGGARAGEYKALEVFARHLVAGWMSWGDEVLKYNWAGHWRLRDAGG